MRGVVVLAFNSSTGEAKASEFEASLVYRASSRTTKRNPVSKNKTNKKSESLVANQTPLEGVCINSKWELRRKGEAQ